MTKELNQDIKDHFKWLVGRLTDEGYMLKDVTSLLKQELTQASNYLIVDMHLNQISQSDIKEITGYTHAHVSIVLSSYWNSKELGFKEKTRAL